MRLIHGLYEKIARDAAPGADFTAIPMGGVIALWFAFPDGFSGTIHIRRRKIYEPPASTETAIRSAVRDLAEAWIDGAFQ